MRELRLVPLTPERVDQAYPLIQAVYPGVTPEGWHAYARRILDRGGAEEGGAAEEGGIATLQDPRGLIAGLFVYRIRRDLDHGRTLVADDVVALDIVRPDAVAEHLADALEEVARQHGCHAVHTAVACGREADDHPLVSPMRALGHRVERLQLCKPLAVER